MKKLLSALGLACSFGVVALFAVSVLMAIARAQTVVVGAPQPFTNTPWYDPTKMACISDEFLGGDNDSTAGLTTYVSTGELGWSSGQVGSLTAAAGISGHPGVIGVQTTAVSGNLAFMAIDYNGGPVLYPADMFDTLWIFFLTTSDANTTMRIGMLSNASANPPTDGIYLEKLAADTSFFGVTRASSVQTRSAALAATDTAFHKIRIRRVDPATVGFTFDNNAEVTQTANITATQLTFTWQVATSTTAARTVNADYFRFCDFGLNR